MYGLLQLFVTKKNMAHKVTVGVVFVGEKKEDFCTTKYMGIGREAFICKMKK